MTNKPPRYAHQDRAMRFIGEKKRGMLQIPMGGGKSRIVCEWIDAAVPYGHKYLIFAPVAVAQLTWPHEFHLWAPTVKYAVFNGKNFSMLDRVSAFIVPYSRIVSFAAKVKALGPMWRVNGMFFDESTFIKSPTAQRTKAAIAMRHLALTVIAMSGNPEAGHDLLGMWSQYYLLDDGQSLGHTLTEFRDRYCRADRLYTRKIVVYKVDKPEKLAEDCAPITFKLKPEERVKMPEVIATDVVVDLPPKAREFYNRVWHDKVFRDTPLEAARLAGVLRQVTSGFYYDLDDQSVDKEAIHLHDAKLNALASIVESADGPILVVTNYRYEGIMIQEKYSDAVLFRDAKNRQDIIDEWTAGKIPMLIFHPNSAGHGLNLQHGGHIIVWFSLTGSKELWDQTNARLRRPGQQWPVLQYRLVVRNSLDQVLLTNLENSEMNQKQFNEALHYHCNYGATEELVVSDTGG